MNTIEAVYERGVFRPVEKVELPEGERVKITVEVTVKPLAKDPAETIPDLAVDIGISDLATNLDYYLYGLPKQNEK